MKRYVYSKPSKPVMSAAQKCGYDKAIFYAKKYTKAMKVLGNKE